MSDDNSHLFGGSVDRSKLEEMKAAAGDDPERQRQVAEVQAQVDAVAESDAAAEKAREEALAAQNPEPESVEQLEEAKTSADYEDDPEATEASESGAPPKSGAGSGRDAWETYATSRGVTVDDDMTRDDIIAACGE